ncbi:MAG: YwaF family protein, partial [Erysipelotrichaceae bacterium]|nr:YwaF family protein [Erysipelotrichaceae bacterium]
LVLECSRDIYIALRGGWKWDYLPFHPCSFSLYFMAIWAYKPNKICGNLLYGYGIVGALCALLFCNWTNQPIWHFQTIYSFLVHGLIIGYTLMAIIGKDIIPESKGIIYNLIFVAIAVPFTSILNNTLPNCNFFFTHAGSEGSPLEFLINTMGVPWWLIGYFGLCALVLAIEFIPLYVIEKRKYA